MKISYQIMPFKTEDKRKEIILKLLSQGALDLNKRDKQLLKYRDENTVDPKNSLEEEFEEQLDHPYFKGYKECVDFYLNPLDLHAGKSLNADDSIRKINWGSKSSFAKGHMGGAQLFIAFNLDKYNHKNKKGMVEVLKGTKDDTSPLSILDETDSEVFKLISTMVKSGSKKKSKRKKKKSKKSKKKKSKKKRTKSIRKKKITKKRKQSGG